ncbi:MAG: hypothetical protein KDB26_09825 [Microthrixaceae bacterium]|nr:hypothetical protein [Microthrixaceae bacterium]
MASLRDLLPVQELDTRALQLRHRRDNLDLRADLVEHNQQQSAQQQVISELEAQLHQIRRAQKEAEDHASLIDDRAQAIAKAMYDGSVTDPKELGSLQTELAQLRANQDTFETQALELMEQADPVEEDVADARSRADEITASIQAIGEQIIVAEAEIDAELDALAAERATVVAEIDSDLVALYDSMGSMPGGIVVAEMTGRRCGGCHLEIPSAQAEQIRSASNPRDSACPECGCLLVS